MSDSGRPLSTQLFIDGTYDIEEFHQKFLDIGDPTEYRAAIELVGSWKEWERIKQQSRYFRRHVREWLDELEIKQKSEMIALILTATTSSDKSSFQAAKWIAEGKYQGGNKAGRPSKKALESEAKEIAAELAETEDEGKRMKKGLILLKGGTD